MLVNYSDLLFSMFVTVIYTVSVFPTFQSSDEVVEEKVPLSGLMMMPIEVRIKRMLPIE